MAKIAVTKVPTKRCCKAGGWCGLSIEGVGLASGVVADGEAGGLVGHFDFHSERLAKKASCMQSPFRNVVDSEQVVLLELLAQGASIEAQHFAGLGLVALDVVHHGFEQGRLHLG